MRKGVDATDQTEEKHLKDAGSAGGAPVPLWKDLLALAIKVGALFLLFVLVFYFVFGLFRNQDADMYPAVKDGDLVMFYRLDKEYAARDLAVLDYEGKRQVRRVVAVTINGALQQEPGIYEETQRYARGMSFPETLKEGEIFVLGDAREDASDSRIYGVVDAQDTLGKVMLIIRRREF